MTPILIATRPEGQNAPFLSQVRAVWPHPLHVIESPLLQIVPVEATTPVADAVILTSVNGVAAAARLALPEGLPAWCVGERTAAAAREAGFDPVTGPGDAAGLTRAIIAAAPHGQLVHIRGAHARGDICAQLSQAGLRCSEVVAYDQQPCPLSLEAKNALSGDLPVLLPLFSPRTGSILKEHGPFAAPLHVIAISDATAAAVEGIGAIATHVAATPDAPAMRDAVVAALAEVAGV